MPPAPCFPRDQRTAGPAMTGLYVVHDFDPRTPPTPTPTLTAALGILHTRLHSTLGRIGSHPSRPLHHGWMIHAAGRHILLDIRVAHHAPPRDRWDPDTAHTLTGLINMFDVVDGGAHPTLPAALRVALHHLPTTPDDLPSGPYSAHYMIACGVLAVAELRVGYTPAPGLLHPAGERT